MQNKPVWFFLWIFFTGLLVTVPINAQMPSVNSACPTNANAGSFALGDIGGGEVALLVCDDDGGNYRTFLSKTGTGPLKAGSYGAGTHAGTATYNLAVDTDGNLIETSLGGGGGITPTPIKTADYTASSGDYVLVDLSGGPITITAPASPNGGDTFGFIVVSEGISNATIDFNGENYFGDPPVNEYYSAKTSQAVYMYVDASIGWIQQSKSRGIQGPGEARFVTTGSHTISLPVDANNVSVVCVGGGGGGDTVGDEYGGGGAGLGWINNYSYSQTQAITGFPVFVGDGGSGNNSGEDSYFISDALCKGGGGKGSDSGNTGGDYTGDGGGSGGRGGETGPYSIDATEGGGGGAGGYTGTGGRGGDNKGGGYTNSSGGGGSGGRGGGTTSWPTNTYSAHGGGGVGLMGQGSNGTNSGRGGSGGENQAGGNGGLYGGGGAAPGKQGAQGAVRIIWGQGRAFPSTNTGEMGYVIEY